MIHSVTCKNFYSFGEPTSLSFVVNDNAPKNNGYFVAPSGARLSKVEAVIGPNASGKTNLLKILPFLKWLITDSFNLPPQAPLPVQQFMFDGYKNKPVEFSVVFEIQGSIYTYSFILDQSKILFEELKLTSQVNKNKSSKKIFARTWNNDTNQYDLTDNFDLPKGIESLLRLNASIISVAARLNHEESQKISNLWLLMESNVGEAGWVGDQAMPNFTQSILSALDFFSDNDILKIEAEKLLSRFDLGLEGFEIEKQKKENSFSMSVKVVHSFDGKKEYIPLHYESSGTKQLFILLKHILQALAQGGIAIIDEFDVNLHPEMVMALFELFIQPETNTKNAQLMFSTHSHMVLSELDKYQIVFTEKNKKGMTESWRLDEMSGVRSDENYFAKYMAGAYGAVPKL